MALTHVDLVVEYGLPVWSTGYWAQRLLGITGGLLQDALAEGAATALQSTWCVPFSSTTLFTEVPSAALGAQASDCLLTTYAHEDPHTELAPRLRAKWDYWTGSPRAGLQEALEVATDGDTIEIFTPGDGIGFEDGLDYWSRFYLEIDDSPITSGSASIVGDSIGDTLLVGPAGISAEYFQRVKGATKRYKPGQWIVWDYLFELDDVHYAIPGAPRIDNDFVEARPMNLLPDSSILWDFDFWVVADDEWPDYKHDGPTLVAGGGGAGIYDPLGFIEFTGGESMELNSAHAKTSATGRLYFAAVVNPQGSAPGDLIKQDPSAQFEIEESGGTLNITYEGTPSGGGSFISFTSNWPELPDNTFTVLEIFLDLTTDSVLDVLQVYFDGVRQTQSGGSFGRLDSLRDEVTSTLVGENSLWLIKSIVWYGDPPETFLSTRAHTRLYNYLESKV